MKRAVLVGDEVLQDALPFVKESLEGEVEVWAPEVAVCTTTALLEGLREWALKRQPDIVMIGSGIADTRSLCFGVDERLTPLEHFGRNVSVALGMLRERTTAVPVWMTITPVDRRVFAAKEIEQNDFGYDNDTISLYNEEAKAIAEKLGVATLDLYGYVKAASRADSRRPEGMRFDERGTRLIAKRIAEKLRACE